ncbi:MAG TPA: PilZ domain-containing protein [Pyrinomonadaceae bacterium]|nr:PilZ domain-containing protein [Pyrinomonadaceae bacterium]
MPELIRSIANRLREYVGDRRRAARHHVRLGVVVSLLDERAGGPPTVAGHTHDVSLSGLAVVLPSIRIGERYLAGEGQTLRLTLKLPNATARLYGTPVRYERLEGDGPDHGYLVGIRLTDTDEGRAALAAYIKTLK